MTESHSSDVASHSTGELPERPKYPVHHVLGIVDGPERAGAARSALVAAGFPESEVDFACGAAAGDALDASLGRSGLAGVAVRVAEWLGISDSEMEMKDRYERALRDGRCVVAVLAPDDERKAAAARIVHEHGGQFVNYLGRLAIEVLYR